ncbi:catechol 2,3-dioxygenase-like lactoylglutathione lyase family enzyme [Salsuginibacillus halophilus]|uniref:Catechol 2,3-dioxygenase-like lactoylglutathione lyase family enzyme n=1 Tax=Salsuginibacillus halophilus TaxID=517424 RepID=A0A2P8H9L6_9BACI|nr:VOC family protein [Salsuginibacillus halophilus]PSL42926.1 catechol 2,3-dioxygenase-like lactoylglutathione lyase family enzyme [Salsuginibacillus halophilus]
MLFSVKTIDHVQLAAPKASEDRARAFFSGILGFEEIEKPEALKQRGGVWFACGSSQLHIGIEDSFSPARKAHPAFEVENLEGLKQHLTKHEISYTIDQNIPEVNRVYVDDPFGNRIELLEPVT